MHGNQVQFVMLITFALDQIRCIFVGGRQLECILYRFITVAFVIRPFITLQCVKVLYRNRMNHQRIARILLAWAFDLRMLLPHIQNCIHCSVSNIPYSRGERRSNVLALESAATELLSYAEYLPKMLVSLQTTMAWSVYCASQCRCPSNWKYCLFKTTVSSTLHFLNILWSHEKSTPAHYNKTKCTLQIFYAYNIHSTWSYITRANAWIALSSTHSIGRDCRAPCEQFPVSQPKNGFRVYSPSGHFEWYFAWKLSREMRGIESMAIGSAMLDVSREHRREYDNKQNSIVRKIQSHWKVWKDG